MDQFFRRENQNLKRIQDQEALWKFEVSLRLLNWFS